MSLSPIGNQIHLIKCKTTCYEVKLKLTLNSRFKSCAFMKIACRLYLSLLCGWMKLEIYGFGLGIFRCVAPYREKVQDTTCVTPRQLSNNRIFSGKANRFAWAVVMNDIESVVVGKRFVTVKFQVHWNHGEKTDGILSPHTQIDTHQPSMERLLNDQRACLLWFQTAPSMSSQKAKTNVHVQRGKLCRFQCRRIC